MNSQIALKLHKKHQQKGNTIYSYLTASAMDLNGIVLIIHLFVYRNTQNVMYR